jgi:hypothetical protein
METRKKRITAADCKRIDRAIKDIKALTEMTKKYPSTLTCLDNVVNRLGVLKVFYAANPGMMDNTLQFPYTLKDWRVTFSDAKVIYTYARKPKVKKDPADSLWEVIPVVFELAIERAGWLSGQEAIIEK